MIIGTTNDGKAREFAGLLEGVGIKLARASIEVPEPHFDCQLNAMAKTLAYQRHYPNDWILVEDSGLVVPALNNWPGALSARFADVDMDTGLCAPTTRTPAEQDRANVDRLLHEMRDVPLTQRGAHFDCVLIVYAPVPPLEASDPTPTRRVIRHKASGWILHEARGTNGFGYDPVFASAESFGKSWAEIDAGRKNLISHRTKAMWDLLGWICTTNRSVF